MKRARDEGARAVTEPPRPAVDPREIDHDAPRDPAARDACAKFFLNNLPEPDAPPECAPPPEETKAFAKSELATRGDSHGLEHAETVRALALAIWDDGAGEFEATKALAEETGFDATKVVETAALLHDVCDHKYVDDATAAGREAVARRDAFLANALPEAEAAAVLAIARGPRRRCLQAPAVPEHPDEIVDAGRTRPRDVRRSRSILMPAGPDLETSAGLDPF